MSYIKKAQNSIDELLSKVHDFQTISSLAFYSKYQGKNIKSETGIIGNLDEQKLKKANIDYITQNLIDFKHTGFIDEDGRYIKDYLMVLFSYIDYNIQVIYEYKDFYEYKNTYDFYYFYLKLKVFPKNSKKEIISKDLKVSQFYAFLDTVFDL